MGYRTDNYDPDGGLLAAEEADEGNYFARHWRGHLPLPQSYWLNGFLANIVLGGVGLAFIALEKTGRSLRIIAVGFILYLLIFLIVRGWALVGIWRSAGRHAARGGAPGWGVVARVVVVLGLIATLGQAPSLGLQVKEYGLIAMGRDPVGPLAAISYHPEQARIEIKGALSAGIADRFEEALGKAPDARLVVLDSEGGRIFEALRMAELTKARGLDTRVEQHCASACTLILLAGKERSAHRFAQIGFHQPDFPGLTEADRAGFIDANRQDYIKGGMEPAFLERALSTPPEEMWYPTHAELVQAHVLTSEEITVGSSRSDRARLKDLMIRMEREIAAGSGTMIDEITRLEGARLSGNDLRVAHSLTRTFSPAEARQLRSSMQQVITDEVCNSPRRTMIEMGAQFSFDYVDASGSPVGTIIVSKCPAAAG